MREYGNWTMEILEYFYAPDKKAAEIKEFIDKLFDHAWRKLSPDSNACSRPRAIFKLGVQSAHWWLQSINS